MFWIPIVLFVPACVYGIGQPHYECGEHGRFEYCIDGIPGCIVGCHCHPGYYFDTESKICEPNAKLVHEYRRLYSGVGPTRVPDIFGMHDQSDFLEANATTINPIDAHIENITKESDDLGDWLYNQFFKTIESQVINNTDDAAASVKPPTRRSGAGPSFPFKKPKRNKKKEDDSLFDSSSGSSDDSSYSGSSSDESDSDASASRERDNEKGKDKNHDDKDHGHRKILMFNKKPKPPLPSFIFMPHAFQTPFFPPLGIPAPPVPMYPMVPVPPMQMMPFQQASTSKCTDKPNDDTPSTTHPSTTTKTTTTTASTSAVTIPKDAKEESVISPGTIDNEPQKSQDESVISPGSIDKVPQKSQEESVISPGSIDKVPQKSQEESVISPGTIDNVKPNTNSLRSRKQKKLLRQLQHMKFPKKSVSKKIRMKPRDNLPDIETDYESPLLDSAFPLPQNQPPMVRESPAEDVDFKYLAQLIHKMDNKGQHAKKNSTSERNVPHKKHPHLMKQLSNMPLPEQPTRRNFNSRRYLEAPDETYYSKLGHQIATLIRRIDGGDHQLNAELPPSQPIFSENSHAPRSYWERSARSLLKRFSPIADEYYGQRNYEQNLFNLESRIETIASTVKPLSLNELENVVFLIDNSKSQLQSQTVVNHKTDTTTKGYEDDNLNVNLLPGNYNTKTQQKLYEFLAGPTGAILSETVKNNSQHIKRYEAAVYNSNNIHNIKAPIPKNTQNQLRGVLMHNFKNAPNVDYRNVNQKKLNSVQGKNMTHYYNNRNFNIANIAYLQKMVDAKLKSEAANSRNLLPRVPWLAPKIASLIENQKNSMMPEQLLPQAVKIKYQNHLNKNNNLNPRYYSYIDNNNRHLHHKEIPVPVQVQIKPSHLKIAPSYFHHELQHFDFFDK